MKQANIDNGMAPRLLAEAERDGIQRLVVGAVIRRGGRFLLHRMVQQFSFEAHVLDLEARSEALE